VLYVVAFLILMLILLFGLEKIWPETNDKKPEVTSMIVTDYPSSPESILE
jgi:hypothetical protein